LKFGLHVAAAITLAIIGVDLYLWLIGATFQYGAQLSIFFSQQEVLERSRVLALGITYGLPFIATVVAAAMMYLMGHVTVRLLPLWSSYVGAIAIMGAAAILIFSSIEGDMAQEAVRNLLLRYLVIPAGYILSIQVYRWSTLRGHR
jgi:hypothetical protein